MSGFIQADPAAMQKAVSALGSLRQSILSHRGRVQKDITNGMHRIGARKGQVRARLASLDRSYDDDDGYDGDEAERYELQCELRELESHQTDGRALSSAATAAEQAAMRLVEQELSAAMAFIQGSLKELLEFQHLQFDSGACRSAAASLPTSGLHASASGREHPAANPAPRKLFLLSIQLPEGFEWIPVDQTICCDSFSREELHYKNSTPEEFRILFSRLQSGVLPRMLESGRNARSVINAIDLKTGSFMGDSLTNTYDLFFGDSRMAVEMDDSEGIRILNGRHRISTARELGWSHIPARVYHIRTHS